ncbi:hypothetical protein K8T06_15435 [bacterium]|nr:hypothetical protein [bacterium]
MVTCCVLITLGILINSALVHASGTFAMEGDARGTWIQGDDPTAELQVIAVSIRKILADQAGDRWMLSSLVEFHEDLTEVMIHDAYVRYKGPMGRWNVTVGRFQLPFGMLSGFSTSQLLYNSLTDSTVGIHSDGGILVSGVLGDLDYGLAATQGLGVHENPALESMDLLSGRVGWTFGDIGETTAGVSIMFGETHDVHSETSVERRIIAMDGTALLGLWITRWEFQTGTLNNKSLAGAFVTTDYGVLPRLDLTGAVRVQHYDSETTGTIYLGLGYRSPWLMMRGGYTYDYSETDDIHGVSIQLYRLISLPF